MKTQARVMKLTMRNGLSLYFKTDEWLNFRREHENQVAQCEVLSPLASRDGLKFEDETHDYETTFAK